MWRPGEREVPPTASGTPEGGRDAVDPRRVYAELGGDPAAEEYPSGSIPYAEAIEEGWIDVAEELDDADPTVSAVVDEARRFVANETGRDEDAVEKADAALVGLVAELLATGEADRVVVLTTDKPAGTAAERGLADRGYGDSVEYRYASETYLEGVTAEEFR